MDEDVVVCSAKGCRQPATHVIVWNNPKLHTPDREKTWVACDDHRQSLADHLDVRGFLKRVDALPVDQGRWTCPTCGADFPAEQQACPVCLQVDAGSCGSKD